jgi:spore maturation protein CgeB
VLAAATQLESFDLIVISHIALGDNVTDISHWAEPLSMRRGALVSFIGNEYDLMEEKVAFLRDARADLVCSQLTLAAAKYLYDDALPHSRVVCMPHALNPAHYAAAPSVSRTVDIGFVGSVYPLWIGDMERTLMLLLTAEIAPLVGLTHDIRLKNLPRDAWARFLQSSRYVIGAESGTYFLQDRGGLLAEAKAWCRANPEAQFGAVEARFFMGRDSIPSGKTISSRHFEPIGTRTAQILVAGDYTGVLTANEHYIPVRKDFMDLDGALVRARDEGERTAMADRAWHHVMDSHTHAHRVNAVIDML